ncbi:MATE family multidrug resistance protein [Pseudomonas duriflava]|uniref:MATE family multidrug resistance protein n=1 Tax=Pseudomonas duriflava TaxID=459528 RepID=A0A562QDQ0_9PSED|nr:MATE family efflux transporter [Pseudomonas duriflava]TWI54823.1 MATE family multidrug resistance protein [Pseudomonas duriflava]
MPTLLADWHYRPLHRRVWALAGPMILSNLTVPLVTLVDSAIAGHLPNAHDLGAVAVGGSVYTAMVGVLGFLRMGTTGFTAQASGRADGSALRQILLQALLLAFGLAFGLMVLSWFFLGPLLGLMKASPELAITTEAFFNLRLLGLPAALASYALIGWLLGTQNARAPLAMLVATNLINLGLEVLFVFGFGWGVKGIAAATALAEWCGAGLGLWLAWATLKQQAGTLHVKALKYWQAWRPLLSVNRDIFIRSLVLQSVFFLMTVQGTRLGESTVAANALLLNGLMLTSFALDGLAHAVEALTGHAIGARDRTTLRRAMVIASGWSFLASLGFALLFAMGGSLFIDLQTNISSVRLEAYAYLPYLAALPVIAMASYLLDGLFIGATRAREMRNAMVIAAALAFPIGLLLQGLGNHGLWLAFLCFMALRGLVLGIQAWKMTQHNVWIP